MPSPSLPASILIGVSTLITAGPSAAQDPGLPQKSTTAPIELRARPEQPLPGARVMLDGTTVLAGSSSVVTLIVTRPGGAAVKLSGKPSGAGAFSIPFDSTRQAGTYRVDATAPGGKGKAVVTFTVVGPDVVPAAVAKSADSLTAAVGIALERVRAGLTAQPVSPARDQALSRLEKLEQQVSKAPAQVQALRKEMLKAFEARAKVSAPIPEWDEYQAGLEDWRRDGADETARLRKLAAGTAKKAQQCAEIDDFAELVGSIGEALAVVQAPFDMSMSAWYEKVPGGVVARGTNPATTSSAEAFAMAESIKLAGAAIQGPTAIITALPGFALDVTGYLTRELFEQYCQKFEGPLKGTFVGESFTRQGEPWHKYTTTLDGRVLLMYPKGTAAKVVTLEGYIEGAGSFDYRDNPAPINRLVPGTVLFHKTISPPGGRYWSELGRPSQAGLPHTFRIPVTGIMAGDSILLQLKPAELDFSDMIIKGRSIWVIMPLGGLVPQIIDAPFALQKAHPIIERVLRRHPVLRIASKGSTMTAAGNFSRDTTNGERTARVRTTLTIQACNPGCLPLPLSAGKKPGGP
jgi:hypothetical protein